MRIDVLTLFPGMFSGPLSESLVQKARDKGILNINLINIRDFTEDKHQTADDSPYGGGPGMVMKPEPIYKAVASLGPSSKTRIILLCPTGETLTQEKANELAGTDHLILICGHYEGVDERVRKDLVTDEVSIGDYVLTGGEIPAMALIDCVSRLVPNVIKEEGSFMQDSFFNGLLDYPSYTKPEKFKDEEVPAVLRSGHHEQIDRYRRRESLERTLFRRPDLLVSAPLAEEDRKLIEEIVLKG
ncbi:MAG TPA: tRNA (guanosine(37)-N1)-methyltransferase TrmD [Candidatus Omnitrophota bacterium]|nr:tRNA (guanosine(37)-N1)-methyltransferase TrmD [Candidatus Omnitrophota bacterium]